MTATTDKRPENRQPDEHAGPRWEPRWLRCFRATPYWVRWGPSLVGSVIIGLLIFGLTNCMENYRTEWTAELAQTQGNKTMAHAEELAENAEKQSLQRVLYGTDLVGISMPGKDLSELSFGNRDLTRANLPDTVLRKADFFGTNLTGANLTGANLTGANLTGANLTDADLTDADLTGVWWDPAEEPEWTERFIPPANAWDPETDG
jgi:hypothetical protein